MALLLLQSCGTGPWLLRKNVYQTYKEDVYNLPIRSLKTDGYYLQVGELPPRVSYRDAIIFYGNGQL